MGRKMQLAGKSQEFINGYRAGYQTGRKAKERDTKIGSRLTDILDLQRVRHGKWEYNILFENEEQRDDWDLQCSECGAIICSDNKEQAEQISMCKWCYNCGAMMDETHDIEKRCEA